MTNQTLEERIAVLETLLRTHEALPIHPLAAQLLNELKEQVSEIREQNARRDEQFTYISKAIDEMKLAQRELASSQGELVRTVKNGLTAKITSITEDMRLMRESRAATEKDLKAILFPILTDIVRLVGAGIILLLAAKALGVTF